MTDEEFANWLSAKLVEMGSAIMQHYDPCRIRLGSCRAGEVNPCCNAITVFGLGRCKYLDKNGCTDPDPKPTCKLWLCRTAIASTDPVCVETLMLLEKVGLLHKIVLHPIIGERYRGADWQP